MLLKTHRCLHLISCRVTPVARIGRRTFRRRYKIGVKDIDDEMTATSLGQFEQKLARETSGLSNSRPKQGTGT